MPLYDRNIGRRTGVDVKAGKNIRILENGFENFSDYWTDESETEDTYEQIFSQKEKENEAVLSAKQTKNKVKVRSMSPFSSVDRSVDSVQRSSAHSRLITGKADVCSLSKATASVSKQSDQQGIHEETVEARGEEEEDKGEDGEDDNKQGEEEEDKGDDNKQDQIDGESAELDTEVSNGEETANSNKVQQGAKPSDSVHEKTGKVAKECDMNTAGEVNGTIVRGEQVLDFKKAKVSSAVQAFKTRKRLTYSTSPETTAGEGQQETSLQPKATVSEFKVPFPKSKKKSPRKSEVKVGSPKTASNSGDVTQVISMSTTDVSSVANTGAISSPLKNIFEESKTGESSVGLKDKSSKGLRKDIESVCGQQSCGTGEQIAQSESQSKESGSENIINKISKYQNVQDDKICEGENPGGEQMSSTAEDHYQNGNRQVMVSDTEKDEEQDSSTFVTLFQKQPQKNSPKKRKSSVDIELKLLRKQEAESLKVLKTGRADSTKEKKSKNGKKKVAEKKESESDTDGVSPNKRKRLSSAEELVVGLPPLPTKPGRKGRKKESKDAEHSNTPVESEEKENNNRKDNEMKEDMSNIEKQTDNLHHVDSTVRVTRSKGGLKNSSNKTGDNGGGLQEKKTKALKNKVSDKGKRSKAKNKMEDVSSCLRVIGEISLNFEAEEESQAPLMDKENGKSDQERKNSDGDSTNDKLNKKSKSLKKLGKSTAKNDSNAKKSSSDKERIEGMDIGKNLNTKDLHKVEDDMASGTIESAHVTDKAPDKRSGENIESLIPGEPEEAPISGKNKESLISGEIEESPILDEDEQPPTLNDNQHPPVFLEKREVESDVNRLEFPMASPVGGRDLNEQDSEDDFEVVEEKMSMRKFSIESNQQRSKGSASQDEKSEIAEKNSTQGELRKQSSEDNVSEGLSTQNKEIRSSEDEMIIKTKSKKKAKQKAGEKKMGAVVSGKKTKRSTRKLDSVTSKEDTDPEEVHKNAEDIKKRLNKKETTAKTGKRGKVKGNKSSKESSMSDRGYREVNKVSTQSESEGSADIVRKKAKGKQWKKKQKVSSDINTGTESEVDTIHSVNSKTRQNKHAENDVDLHILEKLGQGLERLEFDKAPKLIEQDGCQSSWKNGSVKTNVINSTRVNTAEDGCEDEQDLSRLMPSPNLSPIKRILTKPGTAARGKASLMNLTRRSQCPVTPTTITKRRKRKLIGDESGDKTTDNNSSDSVLNPGSLHISPAPTDVVSADKGALSQHEQNASGEESPVEADDEMVSPPEQKRAKKMTPVHHKGKKKTRTSSASGENTTPPRQSKKQNRKVQLNTTPLLPTPSTTPGKHIKSILKNSRFRTRTETHQAENISHSIITKHGATTPVRAPSNKRKTVSEAESSSSPMHIYEVTESQTPKPVHVTPPVKKQVKIIVPEVAEDSGLRRSQRTRVPCLDWFKNERIEYERRKSGGFVIKGVTIPESPEMTSANSVPSKPKQRGVQQKRRKKGPPATPRNMSLHTEPPEDFEEIESPEVPVLDPDTGDDVHIECIKTKDDYEYVTPEGKDPTESDPLILSKIMKQRAFSVGMLILRPFEEKMTQFVRKDTIIFIVKYGKLAVTIHRTTVILETDATFFVPQGNTYSIKNLRCEEAKLWFFRHVGEKPIVPSSSQRSAAQSRK